MLAVAALAITRAEVEISPTRQWVTDTLVAAAASRGDVVYLGGAFNYIGVVTDSAPSFVDQTSGDLATGCATRTGVQTGVRPAVVADPAGGLFVQVPLADDGLIDEAGPFTVPSGESFVRVGDDCRFVRSFRLETFVPGDAATRGVTIARAGDLIYVGGTRSVGFGDAFGRVVAYSGSSGARVDAWDYSQFSVVLIEGVTPAGQLVVTTRARGGESTAGEVGILQPSTGLFARLAVIPGLDSYVKVLGSTLFVQTQGNQPLEAFDLTTGQPKAGWSRPVLSVSDLESAGGRLFVAGSGLGRTGVFAISVDTGALIPDFSPALGSSAGVALGIERLALVETRLFVRGRTLRTLDGEARYLLAAVNATSGQPDPWAPVIFAPTSASIDLLPLGTRMFIGRVAAPVVERRMHLAAVDAETGEILPFDPNGVAGPSIVPPVTALAANDTHVFAGAAQGQIRRVAVTGAIDPWSVSVTASGTTAGAVASLLLDATTLFAGGYFTAASTASEPAAVARGHLLAVDAASATLLPWNPQVTTPVTDVASRPHPITSLTRSGEMVALGGNFTAIGGQPRIGLAMVDATSGAPLLPALTLAEGETVLDTDQDDAETFFVGVDGSGAPIIGVAERTSGEVTRWTVGSEPTSRPSTGIAWSGGTVYSGVEWDIESGLPLASEVTWTRPVAVETGLLDLADFPDGPDGPAVTRFHEASETNALTSPRSLTAQYAEHEVYLSWRPPVRGDVDSYVIRAGGATGESTLANFDTGSDATSFHARAPEGVYFIRIHARHGAAISGPSNEVSFALVPFGCNAPPRAPGTLSGSVSGNGVSLAWGAAINAASYVVEAGSQTGLADLAILDIGRGLALQTAAPPGRYFVRARGVNGCGRGPATNEIELTVGGPPPLAPSNLRAVVSGRNVRLEWDAPNSGAVPAFYQLEAGSGPGLANLAVARTVDRTLTAVGVLPGRYFVRARAGNASGLSAPTADVEVDVLQ